MTSKQRAYLKSLAMKIDPVFRVGKDSISPELIEGVREAIDARELIKIAVLQNCMDDPKEVAQTLAERTRSEVVQVIGKKIVQETRRWDDNKESSHAMRSKEDAQDYRYFPEPDLVPIVISDEWIAKVKANQPELRTEKLVLKNQF